MSYQLPPSLIPVHEPQRLRTLYHYRILNTTPEPVFDHLTSLTAQLFGLPISLVSLVDEEQVFFKSRTGLPELEWVPRADSLCSAAMLETETLVFRDLQQEHCALINPAVAEAAGLRFYAGAALKMPEGHNIGTLCVIGREARPQFTAKEDEVLQQLARLVGLVIELRVLALGTGPADAWEREQAELLERLAEVAAFARYLAGRSTDLAALDLEGASALLTRLSGLEEHLQQRIIQR